MGARELEPDFDGYPGNAVVEHAAAGGGRVPAPRGHPRGLASWSATRAVATCTSALDE